MNKTDFDKMVHGYLTCLLWSELDNEGNPLDDEYSISYVHSDSVKATEESCIKFIELSGDLLKGLEPSQIGHDFCLTRNGHGVGFWDRGLGQIGDDLSAICEVMKSVDIFEGDDCMLHIY